MIFFFGLFFFFVMLLSSYFFPFFWCYAATQLAHQLQQERTQVVCSNKEARKRLNRMALLQWTLDT